MIKFILFGALVANVILLTSSASTDSDDGNKKPICQECKGKNEIYEPCPNQICQPQTCDELGFPLKCQAVPQDDGVCQGEPTCLCSNGYVRNKKGVCIPKEQCPSCGGDKKAVSGCGINCGRLCSNYKYKPNPIACPRICKFNSCDCRDGFVYDVNTEKCVLPRDCTQN